MKDTFYFSHDNNARRDDKMKKLRRAYPDGSGYGIYWMLIEELHESSELRIALSEIENLAYDLHLDEEKMRSIINDFGLFSVDDQFFWSNRLLTDMEKREFKNRSKSNKAKIAARIRWIKEKTSTDKQNDVQPMRMQCERNADAVPNYAKERKGEERKEEESTRVQNLTTEIVEKNFDEIWKTYPKKKNYESAFDSYLEVLNIIPSHDVIISAIREQAKCEGWQREMGRYVPLLENWFKKHCWKDEIAKKDPEDLKSKFNKL